MKSLTRAEVRAYDAAAIASGVPGIVLMENAARGCVEALDSLRATGPFAIVCGKGNNAGDGYVIARLLHERGDEVRVELIESPGGGDAAIAFRRMTAAGVIGRTYDRDSGELEARLASAGWIVDALLGTGAAGAPREPIAGAIGAINAAGRPALAVDLPSGLDADTGAPPGACVRAAATATFVAPKVGFAAAGAGEYTGRVFVVDIGGGPAEDLIGAGDCKPDPMP
jgi:NAD(P)H-hydrate epimerase